MQYLIAILLGCIAVGIGYGIDSGFIPAVIRAIRFGGAEQYGATLIGSAIGVLLLCAAFFVRWVQARVIVATAIGVILASVLVKACIVVLSLFAVSAVVIKVVICAGYVIGTYLIAAALLIAQDEFHCVIPFVKLKTDATSQRDIVLDTSVIIDGRIADLCETSFINGRLIIPRFVLRELQSIADSSDALKRNRGRRGLDILNRLKENSRLTVKIHDADFPEISSVDAKLVKLAQVLGAQVFTHDFNLSKVAELQNVEVLNINQLSNALKPVVLPGELLEVKIIKTGKEPSQGVAYLDDGTMIVVENGRRLIGKTVTVEVTSAYQTQAGRMIFARKT